MGINGMSLVVFVGLNFFVFQLNKCSEKVVFRVLKTLWALLFLGNLFRYVYAYPCLVGEMHLPIEYSTVAYFLVPLMMFLNYKNCRVWASVYGLICGLMYFLTMIVASHNLYADTPPYDTYISYFCHGTLYVNGLIMLVRLKITDRDWANTMLCLLIVSARALLLRRFAVDADELFIYDVLFGNVIRMITPEKIWFITVPIYYAALALLIVLSLKGFFPKKEKKTS